MTAPQELPTNARFGLLAPACAFLVCAIPALAQTSPAPTVSPATLARYDTNHNGVLDPNETAAMNADQRAASAAVQPGNQPDSDVVTLSPFEVVSDTKGYYAANTMSGTRFNSKLEDLAAPITVVTKEQMADFAMLDINDIFDYTASTEGTGTYTDFSINRNGDVTDNVQSNPNNANRIRGIAPANVSFNNFEMSGRMSIDPSITNGVEISRGPNANVFGLGNPSGTVNQVPLSPLLNRNLTEAKFRVDSYDGYRTSLDLNRVLLRGKLAIRGTGVFQHDGFVRKPSGVDTERYNATIKFQPFKNTTITAGAFYMHQYGTRANFVNPRDSVSYWLESGKPTWDPINQVVHVNGQTLGPFTKDSEIPGALQRSFTGNGHSYAYIDQNGIGYFTAPTTFGVTKGLLTPTAGAQTVRLMASNSAAGANSTGNLGKIGGQPLFTTTPSVNNKAIYDWTSINLASVNYDWDTDLVSNVQLDQVFLNTERQTLAGQLAFLREDAKRYRRDHFGVANDNGQSGQLLVDVNERNLDGTPNPYLGRFYIGQDQPRTYYQPLKWDSYRAQLAYKLDLTHEKNWMKWLGMHQISGYDEYKYRVQRRYSFREAMLDNNHPWIPSGISRGNQGNVSGGPSAALGITRSYLRYYVGDPNTYTVNYAPSPLQPGTYDFVWGTYDISKQTVNGKSANLPTPGSGQFFHEPTEFGLAAVTDSTGAGSNTKTILKTYGGVIQSHLLDDRLVTTFGRREDKQYVKYGSRPQQLIYPQGIAFNYDSIDHWQDGDYNFNSGITTQSGAVLRPFRNWDFVARMNRNGGGGHFLANALSGLFFTYNKSDSFLPQDPKINLFFQQLPNTTGHGKDYGVGLNLFDGQLVLRYNHYDIRANGYRQGDASTIAQRVTRIDLTASARFLLFNQMYSPEPTQSAEAGWDRVGWVRDQNPGFTEAQVQAEVAKQMGLPWETITRVQEAFSSGQIASSQDVRSTGNELEINYVSPSRNWTVAANATEGQSFNSNISSDIAEWISQRMPVWTTIRDPRYLDASGQPVLWWTHNYSGSQTAQQNFDSFVRIPYSVVKQQEGKSNPQIRRYNWRVSTSYALAGISDNQVLKRLTVGGAVRWEDKGSIGYYGIADANGVYTDLDASRPIYDKSHTYYDAFIRYRTKLWGDRIGASFQLNVKNLQESGRLQPIAAYPDGTPNAYRIVDPRQFIFTVSFDL
jgi:hypothetical protein